jgi:hypothetical protein
LKANWRFEWTCRLHFQGRRINWERNQLECRWQANWCACYLLSRWFLDRLILWPWRRRRHISPKRRLAFDGLHGATRISRKTVLYKNFEPYPLDGDISNHCWSAFINTQHLLKITKHDQFLKSSPAHKVHTWIVIQFTCRIFAIPYWNYWTNARPLFMQLSLAIISQPTAICLFNYSK